MHIFRLVFLFTRFYEESYREGQGNITSPSKKSTCQLHFQRSQLWIRVFNPFPKVCWISHFISNMTSRRS
jgi:hypothetical protein